MNKRLTNMKQQGFTLIEVMIVVAIIGIISAIGYPSYINYVQETRRSDAHVELLNLAQRMERCKSTQFSYAGCTIPAGSTTSSEGYYTLSFQQAPTAHTFTLQADATGAQSSDADCQTITLDERSQKLPADCW